MDTVTTGGGTLQLLSASPQQTRAFAAALAPRLPAGGYLALCGGMGAGKTTFCQGLAQGLGCIDSVSSPTFAIVHFYRGPRPLAHFDMYRVHRPEDVEASGFYEYLDAGVLVAAEWSENVQAFVDPPDVRVTLEALADGRRRITVEGANP